MQVYLVGGAVRDEQLGIRFKERDWCVVGGSPGELLAQGYKQVGKNFPVFLHPKTGEEHALARTERKIAPGYHGFSVDFSADVTIEEDLLRRDLTINALAKDDNGNLIDPYGGRQDLEDRVLRHVSDAFGEVSLMTDPVERTARNVQMVDYLYDQMIFAGTVQVPTLVVYNPNSISGWLGTPSMFATMNEFETIELAR